MIVEIMVGVEMQVKFKKICLLNSDIKAKQKNLLYNKEDTQYAHYYYREIVTWISTSLIKKCTDI